MTRFLTILVAILTPSSLLAHEGHGAPHIHPHGAEALLVAAAIVVAVVILWRMRRS